MADTYFISSEDTLTLLLMLLTNVRCVDLACLPTVPCFSPPTDVAKIPSHTLTVNSTCGTPPEYYCVENDCSLNCDAQNKQTWHPPAYLLDDFESLTYWKSTNFDKPVFVQLDFHYKLILHQITVTFQFELPHGMYIQRSQDFGVTYKTLVYFATRCSDIFGLSESVKYDKTRAACFVINPRDIQRQISYAPRRDEYVATEVLKGNSVRNFYITSNVKIMLQEFYTPSKFNSGLADKRKYYFAILDVDVQAACYCNGMSNRCSKGDYGTCVCQKNTEGRNCERCKELFNNREWRFGIACEPCNCNNHASKCVYNEIKKYGVCNSCVHNTMGDKCDSCATGYYKNISRAQSDPRVCVSCRCFVPGVKAGSVTCDPVLSRCFCKANVDGALCNQCKDGYYGLSADISHGCLPCGCKTHGTLSKILICDKITGNCPCKLGFTGRTCSECMTGYFGYPVHEPTECRECRCQPSGAIGMSCDKTGQCTCRANYYGVKCEQINIGYYSASVNQLLLSSMDAKMSSPRLPAQHSYNVTDSSGNTYFVLGYSVGLGGLLISPATQLKFNIRTPATTVYDFYLQYITSYDFKGVTLRVELTSAFRPYTCNKGTVKISSFTYQLITSDISPSNQTQQFGSLCLMEGRYDASVTFPPTSAGDRSSLANIFVISLLLLPNYNCSPRFLSSTSQIQSKVIQYYQLASSRKVWPKRELQGARLLAYIYGSYYDSAFECACDRTGTINPRVCNIYGGQCNCKKNIYGRVCERCLPQYYNFSSAMGCDACTCSIHGSFSKECNYHTGQCSCKPNVVERTCSKCKVQYHGITSGQGCKPCNCQPLYSLSSQCDESGKCPCKAGVGGDKCDRCMPGYHKLQISGCIKCKCSRIGTSGNQCNPVTGSCTCKGLTTGSSCEQCKYGYYGFSEDYPAACLPCYCSDQTRECDAANDYYLMNVSTVFSTNVNNNAIEGWRAVDLSGYANGETSWDWAPIYAIERGFAKLSDNGGTNAAHLYFAAPDLFLGNKISSYMYFMLFDLTQEQTYAQIGDSNTGDMVVKGAGLDYRLVTKFILPPLFHQNFRSYRVQFNERHWFKNFTNGMQATSMEMRKTLSNLELLWIRGKWTKESGKFSGLANVFMDYSSYNITMKTGKLRLVKNVEYCTCPIQYSGQFCQHCNIGYTKQITPVGQRMSCIACQCNNHSRTCDPNNGTCFTCLDNTEGLQCEKCIKGYYGIPRLGKQDACKPCACPGGLLATNQFADDCVLNINDRENPYRCIECQAGYSGYRCHVCSDGYYGNPMEPNGKCQRCICNGNVNINANSNCNTTTGECLRCLYNTIGHSCEFCRPGFFGNALRRSCRDCACSNVGSFGNNCQNVTGQCNCKPNVIGRQCDTCAEFTFNFLSSLGCTLCNCNEEGSKSLQCNSLSGKCTCRTPVIGDKCDTCAPGFYNLSAGCQPCNCNPDYSMKSETCDGVTGQCTCIRSKLGGVYSGRTCSECDLNAIGIPPTCEHCHSPCYDNWQKYIENEAIDIGRTHASIDDILYKFGTLRYERVKDELSALRGNLTYISDIFTSSIYNTSMKEREFQQIENYIIEFETAVNQTQQQIRRSINYFETTISNFSGSILLDSSLYRPLPVHQLNYRSKRNIPPSQRFVTSPLLMTVAGTYKENTKANNVSGETVYLTIKKQFQQIVKANASIFNAAQKLSKVILGLTEAATLRGTISSHFNQQYKTRFAVSAYELKRIHDVMVNVVLLQNTTVAIYKNAMSMLTSIKTVAAHAEYKSNFRGSEALAVAQTLSRLKVNSLTLNSAVQFQKSVSDVLKRKVNDELFNVEKEAVLLAHGIRDLFVAKGKTSEAMVVSEQIINSTVPVTTNEIKNLSSQVISTIINEGIINATYTDAQHGLIRAQEVQVRSQQALYVSQSTLVDIRNLDATLAKSERLKASSQSIFSTTDVKLQDLQNTTRLIENQFHAVSGEGGVTLTLLKRSLSDINRDNMCFLNTKFTIKNATIVSQFAATKASEALRAHEENEKGLPRHATKINKIYKESIGMKEKAEVATKISEGLLSDSTAAESLHIKFTEQQAELDALKIETDALEAELAEILEQFEQYELKVSKCNMP